MWDDARQLNATAMVLAALASIALAWSVLQWVARNKAFAFREVVVTTKLTRTNAAHLEAVIRAELSGTFFSMNLDRARASLSSVPWVRQVSLRRQWPDRLEIAIEEHEPLARWNGRELVNVQGEVFGATYRAELPRFEGPDGTAAEIVRRYREWDAVLAPLRMHLIAVRMSPRGGWHLDAATQTGPLAIDVGRDEPTARLERFVTAYSRTVGLLARTGTSIEQVDLRYRNGFAARVPGFREKPPKKVALVPRTAMG
jgi:cell division protein FtsQ